MELSISSEQDGSGRQILTLRGSLDMSSRSLLKQQSLVALETPDTTGIVLDLASIEFLDSSGIGCIVEIASDAKERDISFALRSPSDRVIRILTVAGLLETWKIEPAAA
ncbi:MAG: STAS domain-containing protein [Nakamurella sp.]